MIKTISLNIGDKDVTVKCKVFINSSNHLICKSTVPQNNRKYYTTESDDSKDLKDTHAELINDITPLKNTIVKQRSIIKNLKADIKGMEAHIKDLEKAKNSQEFTWAKKDYFVKSYASIYNDIIYALYKNSKIDPSTNLPYGNEYLQKATQILLQLREEVGDLYIRAPYSKGYIRWNNFVKDLLLGHDEYTNKEYHELTECFVKLQNIYEKMNISSKFIDSVVHDARYHT